VVLRMGEMPTSKELRAWLATHQPQQWIVDPHGRNLDPLHGNTIHLRLSVEQLATTISSEFQSLSLYAQQWCAIDTQIRQHIDQTMAPIDELIESKAAWLLSQTLPPETPLFISSSMPVRDVEFFWKPNDRRIRPFFNRGANGIDGSLSTALGIAHCAQSSVMLTGDLALLHDTNGFLLGKRFTGHLTIVLINNNGGGIFEMLPIAQFNPPFEDFFATPQAIDFAKLCATYDVPHELIISWQQLQRRLNTLPERGIRVLELQTDRKRDAQWRKTHLSQFAKSITH
jgi:2-succinyl-5-enolpyruvyl-6-hydroxy-3-cyclohexene-1-carboxylate synthase